HGATGLRKAQGCLRSFGEGARPAHHQDDDLLPGSRKSSAARVPTLGDLQRASGRSCAWGPPPSTIVSPGRVPEHRDKTGRPAHLPPSGPPAAPGGAYGLSPSPPALPDLLAGRRRPQGRSSSRAAGAPP